MTSHNGTGGNETVEAKKSGEASETGKAAEACETSDCTARVDQLSRIVKQQTEKIEQLTAAFQATMFAYDAIRRVLTEDRELLEEKSKNLVVVHLPEATSEALTAAKDETFVRELIAELRHTALSEALRKDQIRWFRLGRLDGMNRQYHRLLKITLPSMQLRSAALHRIRAASRLQCLRGVMHAYIREDLTAEGLALEKQCKMVTRERNRAAGALEWGVRGTRIIRYTQSRPFTAPTANPDGSNSRQPNAPHQHS